MSTAIVATIGDFKSHAKWIFGVALSSAITATIQGVVTGIMPYATVPCYVAGALALYTICRPTIIKTNNLLDVVTEVATMIGGFVAVITGFGMLWSTKNCINWCNPEICKGAHWIGSGLSLLGGATLMSYSGYNVWKIRHPPPSKHWYKW
jgi:hypothetical protein